MHHAQAIDAELLSVHSILLSQVQVMQGELKTVREFRRKRAEMQHQLASLQSSLEDAEQEHKRTLLQMEQRFFEEKVHKFSGPLLVATGRMYTCTYT